MLYYILSNLDTGTELIDSPGKAVSKKFKPSEILNSVLRPDDSTTGNKRSPRISKKINNSQLPKSSGNKTDKKEVYKPLLDQLQEQTEPEGSQIQKRRNLKKVPGNVQYEEKKESPTAANIRNQNNIQKALNNTNISKKIGNLQQLISEKHKSTISKVSTNKTTSSSSGISSLSSRSTASTTTSKNRFQDTCEVTVSPIEPPFFSELIKSHEINKLKSTQVNVNVSKADKQLSSLSRTTADPPQQGISKIFDVLSSMQLKGSQKALNVTENALHITGKKNTSSSSNSITSTTTTPTQSITTATPATTTTTSTAPSIPTTSLKPKTSQKKDKSRRLSLKEYQAKKQRNSSSSCAEDNMLDGFAFTRVDSLNTKSGSKTADNTAILPRKPNESNNISTETTSVSLVPEDQIATNPDVIGNILQSIQPEDTTTNNRTENEQTSTVDSSKDMV